MKKRLLLSLINNSFKIFLITLLSLILLFSISCDSNEAPTGGIDTYAGDWYNSNDKKFMTIHSDGCVFIYGVGKIDNIIKKSDTNFVMQYDTETTINRFTVTVQYDINFQSDNSGTIMHTITSPEITREPKTDNIFKKYYDVNND